MGSFFWLGLMLVALLIILCIGIRYEDSPKFRYRFKFCFYVFYVSFICLLSIPFIFFRPKNVENLLLITPGIRFASKLLGITWEIRGADILAKQNACVVVCNHQSILDTLGMSEVWPQMRRCATVAKKELIYVFPFGLVAWLCGTVFIDRSRGTKSLMKLSATVQIVQKNQTKLWIFPEGTRHKGDELLSFKKGAFHIAMQSKLPIIPVVISPYTFINDEMETFGNGKVVLSILEPISMTDVTDLNKLVDRTRDVMNEEFQRLSEYVTPMTSSLEEMHNGGLNLESSIPITFGEAKKLL